ncbi:MAG: hypothetical protein R2684_08270 [Pyrinomonadaceae bacterium]
MNVAQRILDYDAIPGFAEQNADSSLFSVAPQLLIHRLQIKIEFTGILRLKLTGLEFNDYIAV